MVSDREDRGQVILIGAIALAFIILGVVVVLNGVLYVETLSSGPSSQSASNAEVVEQEVDRGVGCLLEQVNNESSLGPTDISLLKNHAEDNISTYSDAYRNTTIGSKPTYIDIKYKESNTISSGGVLNISNSTITITYDSNELSYQQNRTIEPGCP